MTELPFAVTDGMIIKIRWGDLVKFLREHYGMSYQEAMLELFGGERSVAFVIISAKDKNNVPPKKEFSCPTQMMVCGGFFAYLTKQRFIDADVISLPVNKKITRINIIYFSCSFTLKMSIITRSKN